MKKPASCEGCTLFHEPFVPMEHHDGARVLFVAEAPGREEVGANRPLVGDAGKIFRGAALSLPVEFAATNAVHCRPPGNRDPRKSEIEHCQTILAEEIDEVDPELIVCMGNHAVQAVVDKEVKILKENGKVWTNTPVPVAMCVHPSYVNHSGDIAAFEKGFMTVISYFSGKGREELEYDKLEDHDPWSVLLPPVAVDIETNALRPWDGKWKSIAFYDGERSIYGTEWTHEQLQTIFDINTWVVHSAQFEQKWWIYHGFDVDVEDDTRIMAYVVDESQPTDLESQCLKYEIDTSYKIGEEVVNLEGEELAQRNVRDVVNTRPLRDRLFADMTSAEYKIYKEVLLPATKTLAEVELAGVRTHPDRIEKTRQTVQKMQRDLHIEKDPYFQALAEACGKDFNCKSFPQRSMFMFDILGMEPFPIKAAKTKSGAPSTKADIAKKYIAFMDDGPEKEAFVKFVTYSEFRGWIDNFLNVMEKNLTEVEKDEFYVFTNLWLGESATGRIISNKPNLQNAPTKGKGIFTQEIFIPRNPGGCFLGADYKQLELRIIAGLSGDEPLIDAFLSGEDLHSVTAREITGKKNITSEERSKGKRINFAIPTGAQAPRISFETGLPLNEVNEMLKRYWKVHWKLKEYFDSLPKEGTVVCPTGMKRTAYGPRAANQIRNFPIQNSALIIHLQGLNDLVPAMRDLGHKVCLPIHDSDLIDVCDDKKVDEAYHVMKEVLESQTFDWLPVPLLVDPKVGYDLGHMVEL